MATPWPWGRKGSNWREPCAKPWRPDRSSSFIPIRRRPARASPRRRTWINWCASDRLRHIAALLKPGGVLAAAIETLAAPDPDHGDYDLLLFPHLARSGELGEAMQARAPLPASAWRALVQSAGFEIIALDGARGQRLPVDFRSMHEPRLAVYDDTELTGASLRLVARKTGGAS